MFSSFDPTSYRWFIIRVAPNAENRAQGELARRGVVSFLPTVRTWRRRSASVARFRWSTRPLIEGYLFIGGGDAATAFRSIFDAGLARGVICQDGKPYELPAKEIVKLAEKANARVPSRPRSDDRPIDFKVGDTVRIIEGAAAGHRVPVERIIGRRAKVLMPFLGGLTLVDVPVDALRVAA